MRLTFEVPGTPTPKGRPRRGKHGGMYTPQRTRDYESNVKMRALKARQEQRWKRARGPVELVLAVNRDSVEVSLRNVDATLTKRQSDLSNIAKAIEDAMNRIAYVDDVQIVRLVVEDRAAFEGLDDE